MILYIWYILVIYWLTPVDFAFTGKQLQTISLFCFHLEVLGTLSLSSGFSSMSFWSWNKVEWHSYSILWGFLPSLGFVSGQDQPLVAPGLQGSTVQVSQPYYCFFVLCAKQKYARTQTSHHPILLSVQRPEGGGRIVAIRSQKQLLQIAQEALLKLGKCRAFTTASFFPSHCLMDNARWLTRLIKHKCFQRGSKNLCGMQLRSCMLMTEVSFQLHGFSSLALDFWSSIMCSGTRRQRTVLSGDALQSACGPPLSLTMEWYCLGYCCWGCTQKIEPINE